MKVVRDLNSHIEAEPVVEQQTSESAMEYFQREMNRFVDLTAKVEAIVDDDAKSEVLKARESISEYRPVITILGQVKAGKTTLLNALIQRPGLLPSDVNPWTSVVTSLHINHQREQNVRAEFTFFERDDWDDFVKVGGRLGQMAERMGAENELAEIREQVAEVQRKSHERLGKNYNLLMGKKHRFDRFDRALIEKYVCLGEDESPAANQGRFADVTRSADLFLENPSFPIGITFRDTPGVNDPFLMREQVTLRSIGDASISIMVLSANQALNSVDLALVQLLSASSKDRLIIFVNRIDDLDDPVNEIKEIRASLGARLKAEGVGSEDSVVFGSAIWAEAALLHSASDLPEESLDAMEALYAHSKLPPGLSVDDIAWNLSGVRELRETIGHLVADGCGRRQLNVAKRDLHNAISHSLLRVQGIRSLANGSHSVLLSKTDVHDRVTKICQWIASDFGEQMRRLGDQTAKKLRQSAEEFTSQAAAAIAQEVAENGSKEVECDPNEFRRTVRKTYMAFADQNQELIAEVLEDIAEAFSSLIEDIVGPVAKDIRITPPAAPAPNAPTTLGRTIVVDLHAQRGARFMRKLFGSQTEEEHIRECVAAEVDGFVNDIIDTHVIGDFKSGQELFREFIDQQTKAVLALCNHSLSQDKEMMSKLGLEERLEQSKRAQAIAAQLESALQASQLEPENTASHH